MVLSQRLATQRPRHGMTTSTIACNLGFLTVMQEAGGYVGGYLVTNQWGRPLEFRLSTAVQPNRVQQILYGNTLQGYVCADLIGKALVDKTAARAQFIFTDNEWLLRLRYHVPVPVGLARVQPEPDALARVQQPDIMSHSDFPEDARAFADWQGRQGKGFDLAEPFSRVREALAEARKMGATTRA